jgi:hypothetical protein
MYNFQDVVLYNGALYSSGTYAQFNTVEPPNTPWQTFLPAGATGPTGPGGGGGGTKYRENFVTGIASGNYDGSLTGITFANAYPNDEVSLVLFYGGILMTPGTTGADYQELSSTEILWTRPGITGGVNVSGIWKA